MLPSSAKSKLPYNKDCKCCSKFTKLRNTYKTTEWEINAYYIFSIFFHFLCGEKFRVRSVFFMHMHELRCKIYPKMKEPDFYWNAYSSAEFFHEEKKVIIFFALLFLNCRLWMKNNRLNYNLASGPFKGERCFRKTDQTTPSSISTDNDIITIWKTPLLSNTNPPSQGIKSCSIFLYSFCTQAKN